MTIGLLLTALGLGLRHGIDWDHIAAIADLSSAAESRRRGIVLSTVYALGHGVVVMALGLLAIAFGASLPEGVDVWMGRVVGLTLIALGAWVLIELVRKGRDFRLRSRWILVFSGTFAGFRRVREARARRRLSVAHDHPHEHDHPHPTAADGADPVDLTGPEHDHAHIDLTEAETQTASGADAAPVKAEELVTARSVSDPASGSRPRRWLPQPGHRHGPNGNPAHGNAADGPPAHVHSHQHRHDLTLAENAGAGNGTAAGIGVLHGIGFESPTQIAVFVASTSLVGVWAGFALLVAWVIGLVVANTFLAVLAAYGLLGADRNFTIYATVAVVVALLSLAMGGYLVLGTDPPLPALN